MWNYEEIRKLIRSYKKVIWRKYGFEIKYGHWRHRILKIILQRKDKKVRKKEWEYEKLVLIKINEFNIHNPVKLFILEYDP